ncbi:uncharacterized protein LOC124161112 [Ischnura elegans]|uniref:uncharacterized protein LOC124161112 n=1 Tax=Ischnura elegans TaxID=197161 RepID=UPI001ED87906|nr:uncharacterized protein LOC124161112 [Ischnura elegans]
MKLLCALALLIVATLANGRTVVHRNGIQHLPAVRPRHDVLVYNRTPRANMNEYVDKLLENAKKFMIENGLDPYQLDDITQSFSATDLIGIVWHGELKLTKGWAQDLSTIYRSGDVDVQFNNEIVSITANLGFIDITFDYDFSAQFMNIGPTGNLDGKANQVQVVLKVDADLNTKKVELKDFSIANVGDVKIEFSGMGTVGDWIVDQLSKVVLDLFKGPIISKVQDVLKGSIEDALANIDISHFLPGRY